MEERALEGLNDDEEGDDEEARRRELDKRSCQEWVVIHPRKSTFKFLWDMMITLCLAASLVLIPITMAFDTERILESNRDLEFIFDVLFTVNIMLNFLTAYQQDIEWRTRLGDIALAYLK